MQHCRAIVAVAATIVSLLAFGSASAHEHREVGEYSVEVGFLAEPALVDEPNGLFLSVRKGHDEAVAPAASPTAEGEHAEGEDGEEEGEPVLGLEETLQAEITYGAETMALDLRPIVDQPGAYTADVIPVVTGAYTFRIVGTIEGFQIDERFTSGPETFAEVGSRTALSFPKQAQAADATAELAQDARDKADGATWLGIGGMILGGGGLVLGLAGFLTARQARATPGSRPTDQDE